MKSILVIDDDLIILESIKDLFEELGYLVTCFSKSIEGEAAALKDNFDLILLDLHIPEKNGLDVATHILHNKPNSKILIITAHPSDPRVAVALDLGVIGILKKPFEIGKILDVLKD